MSLPFLNMQRNVSTDLLRTFVTLVDTGSFTRTGVLLGLSQPTVSVHLKKLQEQIGAELLDKSSPGVKLTPRGEVVLAYARHMLSINDELMGRIGEGKLLSTEIRIGLPCEIHPSVTPLLTQLREENNISHAFEIIHDRSDELLQRYRRGALDVCVTLGSDKPHADALYEWSEPLVWAAAASFPLPLQSPVKVVAAPAGYLCREVMMMTLKTAKVSFRVALTADRVSDYIEAARAGLGVIALLSSNLPPDLKVLEPSAGLPELHGLYYWSVHVHPESRSEAALQLAMLIAREIAPASVPIRSPHQSQSMG